MRFPIYILTTLAILAGPPRVAGAQKPQPEPSPLTCVAAGEVIPDQCLKEFKDWVQAELKYREWAETNRNKFAWSPWGTVQSRHYRPEPPAWLASYCAGTTQADISSDQICAKYNALKNYDWLGEQNSKILTQLRLQEETPTHTSFRQRIHIDVGYAAAQFPSPHIYGVIGIHVGLVSVGPCEVNIIPGQMLMSVPDAGRGRKLQPAVNLFGGGCRISQFIFPGRRQKIVLHANLARVHILGESGQVALGGADLTLMGLSVTFR